MRLAVLTADWPLDRALRSGAPLVQIATWNDFGEGTAIEPTLVDVPKSARRDLRFVFVEHMDAVLAEALFAAEVKLNRTPSAGSARGPKRRP